MSCRTWPACARPRPRAGRRMSRAGHYFTPAQVATLAGNSLPWLVCSWTAGAPACSRGQGRQGTEEPRTRLSDADGSKACMLDRAQLDGGGGSFRFKILCSFGDRIMPRQTDGAPNTSAARPVRRSIHFATRTASCFGREREKENCSDRNCKLHL
jgi:hypothetical protein